MNESQGWIILGVLAVVYAIGAYLTRNVGRGKHMLTLILVFFLVGVVLATLQAFGIITPRRQ